jgi:hypothetical protein
MIDSRRIGIDRPVIDRGVIVLEFILFGVIAFAAGYWAVLWFAGRRDDVLGGGFILNAEPGDDLQNLSKRSTRA